MKNNMNNRIEKDFDDYYGNTKYKGIKDIRYLFSGIAFNQDQDEYGYEDIRYLFNENKDEDVDVKDIIHLPNEDEDKITYKESPFKSIITDIRNKLSKSGDKMIKNAFYYVEEMKELTESQENNIKEKLIKFKNDLIMKNKVNNRIKKDFDNYHGNIKYKGIKDIRYLFDEEDINDIKYLLNEIAFNEDKITHKDIKKDTYGAEKIKKNKIKTPYKESPFKSVIEDIKRGLYYVEKINNLSTSDIENIKKKLVIFKKELFNNNNNNNNNNKIKKHSNECKGMKDIRYLFNEDKNKKIDLYKTEKMKNKMVSEIKI